MSWPLVRLGDIFEITSSKRVHQKDWRTEGIPFYRAREIAVLSREGEVDNDLFIDEPMYEEYKSKFGAPEEGDILVTAVGTLGLTYAVKKGERFYFKDASVIKLRKKIDVDISYIQYAIASPKVQGFIQNSSGATVGTYTISRARETEIPLPPLEEQKRIAAILDKADAIRRKRQQAIDLADDFLRSVFIERFGDPRNSSFPIKELQEVCTKITDGTHHTPTYTDSGVHFLRVTDINKAKVNWNNTKFVSKEEHLDLIKRCHPEKGDVLYSKNGTIGVPRLIDWDTEFSIFVSLCLIKPKKELLLGGYLESFLKTPFALKQATARAKSATVTNLHLVEIKEIKLPIPPLDVQRDWLDFVSNHKDMMTKLEHSMNEANNQFNSISQQAFSGEL